MSTCYADESAFDLPPSVAAAIDRYLDGRPPGTDALVLNGILRLILEQEGYGADVPNPAEKWWPAAAVQFRGKAFAAVPDPEFRGTPMGEGLPGSPQIMKLAVFHNPNLARDQVDAFVDLGALVSHEPELALCAPPADGDGRAAADAPILVMERAAVVGGFPGSIAIGAAIKEQLGGLGARPLACDRAIWIGTRLAAVIQTGDAGQSVVTRFA